MHIHYIFAHPKPTSFNTAMFQVALETIREKGDDMKVSSLYAMHFNPNFGPHDFTKRIRRDRLDALVEALHAAKTNTFAHDIANEMRKVKWADMLIFHFPIYFSSCPAIVKGWFDRVFQAGFAFNPETGEMYEKGLLRGKKAQIVCSCGATKEEYSAGGLHGDIHELLRPITHATLEFAGIEVLPPYIVYGAYGQTREEGKEAMDRYREFLKKL